MIYAQCNRKRIFKKSKIFVTKKEHKDFRIMDYDNICFFFCFFFFF
jgi:hypothetical protein